MEFSYLDEFNKEFKQLLKKYPKWKKYRFHQLGQHSKKKPFCVIL